VLLNFVLARGDAMAPEGRLAPEEQLVAGRYRLVRMLGAGGLSRVWLAADETLHREVAIKECALPTGLTGAEQELVRGLMLREARAFARVSDPNVIQILDVLAGEDKPWIVMEYVASRSLLQVIQESGPVPPERAAAIGLAVLNALNAASRAGVLHLDVKPANVLIGHDGRIVLSDFGPAVTHEGVRALAGAGIILGSPKYVAPERLLGGVSTAQADLWSLGATLYHAVEGRPPYVRETTEATLRALADSTPDPPRRAGPLTGVLEGLLRRDPADRLPPAEVADRLRRVAGQPEPPPAPAEPPLLPSARPGFSAPSEGPGAGSSTAPGFSAPSEGPGAGSGTAPRWWVQRLPRRRLVFAAVLVAVAAPAAVAAGAREGDHAGARTWVVPTPVARTPLVLPSGFRWWTDPSGFRVAVPSGWRRSKARGVLVFSAAAGSPNLRISRWASPPRDIVAALIAEEHAVRLASYRRIRIDDSPEAPGAVWEYTFQDPRGGPTRSLRSVLAVGGHTYVVEWRAPRTAWATELQRLAVVLDSFTTAPGA
jgi:hypothetical protein